MFRAPLHLTLFAAAALVILCMPQAAAVDDLLFYNGFEAGTPCAELGSDAWACFTMPYSADPLPDESSGPGGPLFAQRIDAYFLIDRSGSMSAEINSLRDNLGSVVSGLQCAPAGTGSPPNCIPDLWAGAGTIGYSAGAPYQNHLDLASVSNFSSLPTTEDLSGCCSEATLLATWAAITGDGTAASGCAATSFPPRASCAASPAAASGFSTLGYPCFRNSALPVILVYSDEAPTANLNCPLIATVTGAAQAADTHIVGMTGSSADAQTSLDFAALALGTDTIDTKNGNAPLVFSAADTNAPAATTSAMLTLHAGIPLDNVTAEFVDGDPFDSVDIKALWLDRIEAKGGDSNCLTPLPMIDTDDDGFPDTYVQVPSGTTLCWSVVVKPNIAVAATGTTQVFNARLDIVSGRVPLESLPLLFVVPTD